MYNVYNSLTSRPNQLSGAIEYTDCISAEDKISPPNKCPVYDTKPSDGEVPVLELCGVPFYCHCSPVHSGPEHPIYGSNRTV